MEYIGKDRLRNHVISAQCELANCFNEKIENLNLFQAGQLYLMMVRAQRNLDKVVQTLTEPLPENQHEASIARINRQVERNHK